MNKKRLAHEIVPILQNIIIQNEIDTYIEPMTLGFYTIDKIFCKNKIGCSNSEYIIDLMERRRLETQDPNMLNVLLTTCDYFDVYPSKHKTLIYCTPLKTPSKFWQWCREKSQEGHIVIINTLKAPADFHCMWQQILNKGFKPERLFVYGGEK